MPTIHIHQFLNIQPNEIDAKIDTITTKLPNSTHLENITIGQQIQNPTTIQITSSNKSALPGIVTSTLGQPRDTLHVAFHCADSLFAPTGPFVANVVEYAANWFAASRVTPEFRRKFEGEFHEFDEIFRKGCEGGTADRLAVGWSIEEDGVSGDGKSGAEGEKKCCFVVARGWDSMSEFERSIQTNEFREAIPILYQWGAEHKMWHVQRKA